MYGLSPMLVLALESELRSTIGGERGRSSQAGTPMDEILPGPKPLEWNFSSKPFLVSHQRKLTSGSSETTEEWSKAGGQGGAGTLKRTRCSSESMRFCMLTEVQRT